MDSQAHGPTSAAQNDLEQFSAHPGAPGLPLVPLLCRLQQLQWMWPATSECLGTKNGANHTPVRSETFSELPQWVSKPKIFLTPESLCVLEGS